MLQTLVLNIDIVTHIQSSSSSPLPPISRTMSMPYPPPEPVTVVDGGFGGPAPGFYPPPDASPYPPSAGAPYPPAGGAPYPPAGPPGPGFGPPAGGDHQPGAPTAPPIADFGQLPVGYEQSGYDRRPIPPPSIYPDVGDQGHGQGQGNPFIVPEITEQDVREALEEHVSNKWCWGKGAISDIEVTRIEMSSSYHYHLDTFTEARETAWTFEPYNSVSGAHGPPPGYFGMGSVQPPAPWSIDAKPDKEFKDAERKIEIPKTAMVRACHGKCAGTGRMRCTSCNGTGHDNCTWCNGTGMRTQADNTSERCSTCQGSGKKQCISCSGNGLKTCDTCKGSGNVKFFIQLHIKWDNHDDDYVSGNSGLKEKYIKKVDGRMAVEDENIRVFPLSSFPDPGVAEHSKQLLEKHTTKWPMERIMKQRQSVKVVPIATVHYKYKDDVGQFYVYGAESDRSVYFKDYPNRICYCCSIA